MDHQIGQIDEEKGAVLAESVDQESCIEDEPGCDAVAGGGPPVAGCKYMLCKYSPIRRIVAGWRARETGYGSAPASEHRDALLSRFTTDVRDV